MLYLSGKNYYAFQYKHTYSKDYKYISQQISFIICCHFCDVYLRLQDFMHHKAKSRLNTNEIDSDTGQVGSHDRKVYVNLLWIVRYVI